MATEQHPPEEQATGNGAGRPALSAEQRARVATAVRREAAPQGGLKQQVESLVYVWPHLVIIEFIAALVMMLSLVALSMVVNAPLEGHANADRTPNPSKAPWYFLNLQELLLHMHPALAGVIVPAGALALIALIPYIDRDPRDMGKWAGTEKSKPIIWFTTIFTTVVLVLQVLFDEFVGVKPLMKQISETSGNPFLNDGLIVDILVPTVLMLAPIGILVFLIKAIYRPVSTREWMVCLFTGFFVTYIILTVFGTFFRGQGMHLLWPWDPHQVRVE
ncbi:MAG: menaquinol-cytochrome C reductase [Chloroflexota bacterium]